MIRRSRQVLISGVFGLLFTIGFGWWLLTWQQGPGPPRFIAEAQTYWHRYADPSLEYGPAKFHHNSGAIGCDFLIIDARPPDAASEDASPRMMITRAGFPFRALEGMHSWGPAAPRYSWAIPIEPRGLNVAWLSVLPCRPLALGMLADVALYGGIFWLLVFGPFEWYRAVKTRARLLFGCCPKCGYDLRNDLEHGCPECGWRREQ